MKVAIFSPYRTVVPHFETELEIAQRHLDQGDLVDFVSCVGGLSNCDFNPNADPAICKSCVGRRQVGLQMLTPQPMKQIPIETNSSLQNGLGEVQTEFDCVEKLKRYRVENFDIGYAALSSLVSLIRDPEPDLAKHQEVLKRLIHSAASTYNFTKQYIADHEPELVYVFNGRFASTRAVLRACESSGIDCFIHERGCDNEHYDVFKNHLPHDIKAIEGCIRQKWNEASDEADREMIAQSWFTDRVNRVEKNWQSFVKKQQTGLLPGDWNPYGKNLTIFCSSDDEFVAIGDQWANQTYPNQVDAIRRIGEAMLRRSPTTKIYLRVHPNLAPVNNRRKDEMLALDSENLLVIPPDAEIDTYELMKQSDTVVSFGSSVGIEANFWGKPSVLLGPCFYGNLGGTYRPGSHKETIDLLSADLEPQSTEGALMYGFWLQTRGIKYEYYAATGFFEGKFKGQGIWPEQKSSLGKRIRQKAKRVINQLAGQR